MVTDKKTGRAVAGVRVRAMMTYGRYADCTAEEVTTGKDGAFTIGEMPAGPCTVFTLGPKTGLSKWAPAEARGEVKAGKTTGGFKLELVEGGVLEVSVRDANTGAPVVGDQISLYQERPRGLSACVSPGSDGSARVRLVPGKWRATTWFAYGYEVPHREKFEIAAGKTTRLEMQFDPLPVLKGIVRDAAGEPVGGAEIVLVPGDLMPMALVETYRCDAQGRFEIHVRSNSLTASARVVARVAARNLVGAVPIGKDLKAPVRVNLAPGTRIVGQVVGPKGKPIAGAMVGAFDRTASPEWSAPQFWVAADTKGRYELPALLAGREYQLEASARGYGQATAHVDVPKKNKGPVKIERIVLMAADRSISGRIFGRDGEPVAGASVSVRGDGQPYHARPVYTGKNGTFKIEGLCAGEVSLTAHGPAWNSTGSTEADAGETDVAIQLKAPTDPGATSLPAPSDEDF